MKRPRFVKTVPNNGEDDKYTEIHPEDGQDLFISGDIHGRPKARMPKNPKECPEGIIPTRYNKD